MQGYISVLKKEPEAITTINIHLLRNGIAKSCLSDRKFMLGHRTVDDIQITMYRGIM